MCSIRLPVCNLGTWCCSVYQRCWRVNPSTGWRSPWQIHRRTAWDKGKLPCYTFVSSYNTYCAVSIKVLSSHSIGLYFFTSFCTLKKVKIEKGKICISFRVFLCHPAFLSKWCRTWDCVSVTFIVSVFTQTVLSSQPSPSHFWGLTIA